MTWIAVKRWLAEHPAWTIVPQVPACAVLTTGWLVNFAEQRGAATGVAGAAAVVHLAAVGAWAFWIGCLRIRAGLTTARAEAAARRGVIVAALMSLVAVPLIVGVLVGPGVDSGRLAVVAILASLAAAVLSSPAMYAAGIGLLVANRVAARKIAAGTWEVTVPLLPRTKPRTTTPWGPPS